MRLAAFPKCYMEALCVARSMSVFDWIDEARALQVYGVEGLELYPGFFTDDSPRYLAAVSQALLDAGFCMPMFCCSPDFTHPDADYRAGQVRLERKWMDMAAFLGARTCRVLSGQRRPEVTREDGIRWTVECIEQLLPYAERRGVILAMENHFKDTTWEFPEFAQPTAIFCAIVEQIESPWFGVNYDPSNTLLAGEDPLELLDRVAHRVVSMHASDRRPAAGVSASLETITDYSHMVHGEIGTGLIDYPEILERLRRAGFDGWVSIEDGMNGIEEIARSARYLSGIGVGALSKAADEPPER